MKHTILTSVDGTSALASSTLLETEFAKDRWDARNIPGLRYAPHKGDYYIVFTGVPAAFRPIVKDYVRFQLAADRTAVTLAQCATYLSHFFTVFSQRYPNACTLHDLTEQDVDAFVLSLKAEAHTRGLKNSDQHIWKHVHYVEGLLSYLERIESPVRPNAPTARIIWPHHYPHLDFRKSRQQMKYIPQVVLNQLDTHIQHLTPAYIPIVIILRASGWRISDVLYLKQDACLEQVNGNYWLVGDMYVIWNLKNSLITCIMWTTSAFLLKSFQRMAGVFQIIQKTRVLGHRIPITDEVAAVVLAQIAWVKQHYSDEENPHRWLFPASKHGNHRKSQRFLNGDPLRGNVINTMLNRLAIRYQIQDEQGRIFHFRLHAFRHTKAVELINGGMSLVLVQQWMAHASPEMTLIYAKILDETMRRQWEKTVQHGIVQFNDGRPEYVPGKKMLRVLNEENSFDPLRVREHRANLKMPLGTCTKTPKLICKFTELPCFHCPAYVLTPEDLPALEAYEQQILERIEIGKQAGNAYWIEVNQKNLDVLCKIKVSHLR